MSEQTMDKPLTHEEIQQRFAHMRVGTYKCEPDRVMLLGDMADTFSRALEPGAFLTHEDAAKAGYTIGKATETTNGMREQTMDKPLTRHEIQDEFEVSRRAVDRIMDEERRERRRRQRERQESRQVLQERWSLYRLSMEARKQMTDGKFERGDKVRFKGDPTLDADDQFEPDGRLQIGAEGVVTGKARTCDVWVDFGFDKIPMHASELELVTVARRRRKGGATGE